MTTSPCAGACGNDGIPINNQTAVSSAALFNAITDPDVGLAVSTGRPLAWYEAQCGEIAGICDQLQATLTIGSATWVVQKQWSRMAADCVGMLAGGGVDVRWLMPADSAEKPPAVRRIGRR